MTEQDRQPQGGSQSPVAVNTEPADPVAVREHLARILKSRGFAKCHRLKRFLTFLVEHAIEGDPPMKEYCVAIAVFDRDTSFDPRIDPIVRVEACRLRRKVREYYAREGRTEELRIVLPKGAYLPVFSQPRARRHPGPGRESELRDELSDVKRKLTEVARIAEESSRELRTLREKIR